MFKKFKTWLKYRKAFKRERLKIEFNCENCDNFYPLSEKCSFFENYIKNPSCHICDEFEVSPYKIEKARRKAISETCNFREVKDE